MKSGCFPTGMHLGARLASALFTLAFPLAIASAAAATETAFGRTVWLDEARIDLLRDRVVRRIEPTFSAWQQVQESATANVAITSRAPHDWYVPGFYRDAEGHRAAKRTLQDEANAAYSLALTYRITGDARCAAAAVRLIDGWATRVQTLSQKDDSTLSFSYHFPPLILAADLLRKSPAFPEDAQTRFRTFVREKALPQNSMAKANNWGNWGLVLVLASASYLGDRELFDRAVERWKYFIEHQIAADGHLPHEVNRNQGRSGLWYSHFSLLPQTIAAEIARVNGADLYDYRAPNGRTLRAAYARVAPWSLEPATFPYFRGDPAALHGSDYASYFELLVPRWPSPAAAALLAAKRPLSASHGAPWLTFTHGEMIGVSAGR